MLKQVTKEEALSIPNRQFVLLWEWNGKPFAEALVIRADGTLYTHDGTHDEEVANNYPFEVVYESILQGDVAFYITCNE